MGKETFSSLLPHPHPGLQENACFVQLTQSIVWQQGPDGGSVALTTLSLALPSPPGLSTYISIFVCNCVCVHMLTSHQAHRPPLTTPVTVCQDDGRVT